MPTDAAVETQDMIRLAYITSTTTSSCSHVTLLHQRRAPSSFVVTDDALEAHSTISLFLHLTESPCKYPLLDSSSSIPFYFDPQITLTALTPLSRTPPSTLRDERQHEQC